MDTLLIHHWLVSDALSRLHLAAAIAGILSHVLYFIRGYHDSQALRIFLIHVLVYLVLCTTFIMQDGASGGLLASSSVFATYLVFLFSSIVAYRVFFHPLRHFPGPLAAKISKLYALYAARNGQMHIEQNKLFKYGDIVRIGNLPYE